MCVPWLLSVPWSLSSFLHLLFRELKGHLGNIEHETPLLQQGWVKPLPSIIPVCFSPIPEELSWELMLGASFLPILVSGGIWAGGGLCGTGLQSLLVPFPAHLRAEEVTCSWYIHVQDFAGCRASSLIFPNQ